MEMEYRRIDEDLRQKSDRIFIAREPEIECERRTGIPRRELGLMKSLQFAALRNVDRKEL